MSGRREEEGEDARLARKEEEKGKLCCLPEGMKVGMNRRERMMERERENQWSRVRMDRERKRQSMKNMVREKKERERERAT